MALERFLHDALTGAGRSLRATSEKHAIAEGLHLEVGSRNRNGVASASAIHDALLGLGTRDFVILNAGPENYIQTMLRDGAFAVELRRGPGLHFQAARRNAPDVDAARFRFSFEETLAAFLAFGSGTEMPPALVWLPMSLPD